MQKFLHGLVLFLTLGSIVASAQDFSYPGISIESVTFSGGNLNIRNDNGSGVFTAPQWTSSNQKPVAYASNHTPTVSAVLDMNCVNAPDSIWVRGIGPDTMSFAAKYVAVTSVSAGNYQMTYPATAGSHLFADSVIRFFKPYVIFWEISFDAINWRPAGMSENTLYVTRSQPMAESGGGGSFKWYQTVFDLSCRNAEFQTSDTAIISHVWTEFTDHVVLNWNGDSLFYYKAMNSPNVSLGSLLMNHDAECYTFAQLWLASLKIQGIVRTNNYVFITPINNTVCGHTVNRFIVKDWVFGTASATAECAAFPYKNTYTGTYLPSPYTAYSFTTADVTDADGIPGSCTINPSSYFNNHQISKIDGVYYDACYGVTFNLVTDIPTAAFSGWGYRYTDAGGVSNAHFSSDMSQSSLDETITTW